MSVMWDLKSGPVVLGVVYNWGFQDSQFIPFTTIFLLKKKLGPLFKFS